MQEKLEKFIYRSKLDKLNKLSHSIQKMTIMELSQMCGMGIKKYKQHTNLLQFVVSFFLAKVFEHFFFKTFQTF